MSLWIGAVWPTLVCLAVLFIPGFAVIAAAGLRGVRALAVSPVLSVGLVAGSAVLYGAAHLPWGWSGVAICAAAVTVAVLVVRLLLIGALGRAKFFTGIRQRYSLHAIGRRIVSGATMVWAVIGGLAVSVIVVIIEFVRPTGSPANYGQLQDTMFHFNIVRYILDTGIGSSLKTGAMDGSVTTSTFYPSAWHDVVALIVEATGVSIPVAATAMTLALLCVVWPLANLALGLTLFKGSPLAGFVMMIFSTALTAFPWRFLTWGVLYSNQLAMAVSPAFIAVVVFLFTEKMAPRRRVWIAACFVPIGFGALALAQPNTVFGVVVYLLPLIAPLVWRWTTAVEPQRRRSLLRAALYVGIGIVGAAAWLVIFHLPFLKRTVTWVWPSFQSIPQAFGEAVLNGFNGTPAQLIMSLLIVFGVVIACFNRRALWFTVSYAIFAFLFILASGSEGTVRNLLTGFWYHDSYRLAAFAAAAAVPVATVGALRLIEWLTHLLRSRTKLTARRTTAVVVAATIAVVAVNIVEPAMSSQRGAIKNVFAANGGMLTPTETAFLKRVSDVVPHDAKIANNPYDGSALGYAFNNSSFLFPAMDGNWLGTWGKNQLVVASRLNKLNSQTSTVCSALDKLDVHYLVQLEPTLYSQYGYAPDWRGLRVKPGTPGFQTVLTSGSMALFKITGCA